MPPSRSAPPRAVCLDEHPAPEHDAYDQEELEWHGQTLARCDLLDVDVGGDLVLHGRLDLTDHVARIERLVRAQRLDWLGGTCVAYAQQSACDSITQHANRVLL